MDFKLIILLITGLLIFLQGVILCVCIYEKKAGKNRLMAYLDKAENIQAEAIGVFKMGLHRYLQDNKIWSWISGIWAYFVLRSAGSREDDSNCRVFGKNESKVSKMHDSN